MKLSTLKKSKVAIWGFGVEGQATATYLQNKHIDFSVLCQASEVKDDVNCLTQKVDVSLLNQFDIVIKSPGISAYDKRITQANTLFTSATALWFANERHKNPQCKIIAITGTKGKSTTASLLAHVLQAVGKTVNLVGNIGKPLLLSHCNYDFIVMEASSFQIYDGQIKADLAVVLNLFAEHLDWHHGEENYYHDKIKIFTNATVKIINHQNRTLSQLLKATATNRTLHCYNDGTDFLLSEKKIYTKQATLINADEIQLLGKHNLENILAVLEITTLLKIAPQNTAQALKSFVPLPHRLQKLGKIGQHYAINDSIATTPMATIVALQTVVLAQTTVLIGGFDRGHDWSGFVQKLALNPPNLIIINGDNAKKLKTLFDEMAPDVAYLWAIDLHAAIKLAQEKTPVLGTILLSPGAPSFDQFNSYIERGEFFEHTLKNST